MNLFGIMFLAAASRSSARELFFDSKEESYDYLNNIGQEKGPTLHAVKGENGENGSRTPELTYPAMPTDAGTGLCDPYADACNAHTNKAPPLTPTPKIARTIETILGGDDDAGNALKRELEHAVGNALRGTKPVQWMTREFGKRLYKLLVEGAALYFQDSRDAALERWFGTDYVKTICMQNMTGWAGSDPTDIADILLINGNIREVFVLAYCIFNTEGGYYDLTNMSDNVPLDFFKNTFNEASAAAVKHRRLQIRAAEGLERNDTSGSPDRYFASTQGVISFCWPSFQVWSRFDFSGPTWKQCREWPSSDKVKPVGLMSNDSSIDPPLSDREIKAQCGNETPPCELHWIPGSNYIVTEQPINGLPGYVARATALNYRYTAGPSSTTVNAMEMALMLGFSDTDLVILRAAMLAWMLPVTDHSFYEIMAGADPYILRPEVQMKLSPAQDAYLGNLVRMWPPSLCIRGVTGLHVWEHVCSGVGENTRKKLGEYFATINAERNPCM